MKQGLPNKFLLVAIGALLTSCSNEQTENNQAPADYDQESSNDQSADRNMDTDNEQNRAVSAGPPAQLETKSPAFHVVKANLPGKQIFEYQCAPCHGAGPGDDGMPMLPGTMTLQAKYDGVLPAPLELRTDLTSDSIALFVRRGVGAMPSFRKSELSDEDISLIADYLKATAIASGQEEF